MKVSCTICEEIFETEEPFEFCPSCGTPFIYRIIEEKKPCDHKETEFIDFSLFTGKSYIKCKKCGLVLEERK